jgi:hypothetical protein
VTLHGQAQTIRELASVQGYYVGRVERNLYWVTDGICQSAFLATPDGVALFDAPPSIGHNLRRAVDEIAAAAAPDIEKYTGVLAAADVFTESTTFQVMQSIRLDLGYGFYAHP